MKLIKFSKEIIDAVSSELVYMIMLLELYLLFGSGVTDGFYRILFLALSNIFAGFICSFSKKRARIDVVVYFVMLISTFVSAFLDNERVVLILVLFAIFESSKSFFSSLIVLKNRS